MKALMILWHVTMWDCPKLEEIEYDTMRQCRKALETIQLAPEVTAVCAPDLRGNNG